jgi:nitronate monooxygenase
MAPVPFTSAGTVLRLYPAMLSSGQVRRAEAAAGILLGVLALWRRGSLAQGRPCGVDGVFDEGSRRVTVSSTGRPWRAEPPSPGVMMAVMAMSTGFTALFGVEHPIALAPMGRTAGGELVAAVSNGGGLGLLGGGSGEWPWLARELPIAAEGTSKPWGVGFQSWAVDAGTVERALGYSPRAVMLSFGDPRPFAGLIRQAGAALIIQVTDLEEARQAVDLGADVIVAQGTEAGGHGAQRGWSALPFVPVVVDLAAPVPVLAAGGIADGRGVAAALALGAAGALIGTRFQATAESLADPSVKQAIVAGCGEDTERSRVLDIARGSAWPAKYPARTLPHPFLAQWRGREAELAADTRARQEYRDGVARGELPPLPVWAGEAIDLVTDVPSAAGLVSVLAAQAEEALARAAGRPGRARCISSGPES